MVHPGDEVLVHGKPIMAAYGELITEERQATITRANAIQHDLVGTGYTLPQAALKWVLAHPAVSVVIPGIRNVAQAEANCAVSDLPAMPEKLVHRLHRHNWRRGVWYGGK